jgi:hypothetical protein
VTKRRLAPKEQQFVEDYLAELNRAQSLPIFDKMSLSEVAKHVTSAMEQRVETREALPEIGIVFPDHLVTVHAKFLTFKWFSWSVTEGNRQLAIADLTRRYRSR